MIFQRLIPLMLLAALGGCASAPPACPLTGEVALQILGSGGPIADDDRAGSSYLVWDGAKSRFLVDLGSGASVRFGVAGGRFNDLDFIALSHLHTDHSSDLPALLKSGNFARRKRPLGISGPNGNGPFPPFDRFLQSLIGPDGAYGYLSGYLTGSDNLPRLDAKTVDAGLETPTLVYANPERQTRIRAFGVPHAIVPTLAYRITLGDREIVFASDQNGNDEAFIDFARDADVLVMHMVVPENITGAGRKLHAPPSRIGQIAARANAGTLVLSHFMARSLRDIDGNVARVEASYDGNIVLANDLGCVPVTNLR